MPDLISNYREMVHALRTLEPTLAAVHLAQFQSPPRSPHPTGELHRRDTSVISDPTADVVMDERRLSLRAEVQRTEVALDIIRSMVTARKIALDKALSEWEGGDEE